MMDNTTFLSCLDAPYIERLNDEILSEVFLYCCRQSPSEPLLSTDAPLNVSSVSDRWRRVALTSPRLWSCISFRTSDHPDDTHNTLFVNSLDCCKAWVDRSGAVPLKLRVTSFSYIKPTNGLMYPALRNQRHRIVEAHLFLNFGHLVRSNDMNAFSLAPLPRLEKLTISHTPTLRESALTVDFSHARSLREVSLLGNIRIAPIRSSLKELRHFTYAKIIDFSSFYLGPTLNEALRVIYDSPNLEEVYLRDTHIWGTVNIQGIRSESLRKLSLVLDKSVDIGSIYLLDQLTLPALEDAEFNFQRISIRALHYARHPILALFQRSEPPIKRLCIGGGCVDDAELLDLMRLSPTLRRLELMCHVFVDLHHFLGEMTLRPESASTLCLELETIMFYACPWGVSGQGMADMILSRCIYYCSDDGDGKDSVGKLREVRLCRMGYLDLWRDEAIQDCVREGLTLDIVA